MSSNGWLICFPLLVCLLSAPVCSARETRGAADAGTTAKAESKKKAKPKAKPVAKGKAKPAAAALHRSAAVKPPSNAASNVHADRSDQVAVSASELDLETVVARRAVVADPADIMARERLARIAVVLAGAVLDAEAVGDTGKAAELARKLGADLHDTGWRVQKMAQRGDLVARQAAGLFLERGLLLAQDANKSCAEFLLAAEQLAVAGWHAAQCLMKYSPDRAWKQMERAAASGHATAQEWMGRRCLGVFGTTDPDHACARFWLAQSASQGRSRSQTLLAYLLMNGHGGPADEPRAARLYRMAADQGDVDAQNNLGEIHEMGRGTVANPEEALRWYQSAAEQGLASAQFNAGKLLALGIGSKRDRAGARALLIKAENNGIEQARQVLNWLDRQSALESREYPAQTSTTVLPDESRKD